MATNPTLVPSSLQRIRSFLGEKRRMKVKPWAGVEEILDAFHSVLAAHQGDDGFWDELQRLMRELLLDMDRRTEGTPGQIIDNEVLTANRQCGLLAEIRSVLASNQAGAGAGGFGRLAARLSMPAAVLLLLMGGVTAAGCNSSALRATGDAAGIAAGDTASPVLDASPAEPLIVGSPDAATATSPDVPTCDGTPEIWAGLLAKCEGLNDAGRESLLGCIQHLDSTWHKTFAEQFGCSASCFSTTFELCLSQYCARDWDRDGGADPSTMMANCMLPVYIGVRFE